MVRTVSSTLLALVFLTVCGCRILPDTRPETAEEERALLEDDQVLLYTEKIAAGQGRDATAITLVNARPEAAWKVLTDYNGYDRFFPRTERSLELLRDEEVLVFLHVDSVMSSQPEWLLLSLTEDADAYTIRFEQIQGKARSLAGSWTIEQYAEWTKLTFHTRLDLGFDMPDFFWDLMQGWLLRSVLSDAREVIEDE